MTSSADPNEPREAVAQFIRKWSGSGGAERANYQLFLAELCDVLGVDRPQPAGSGDEAYAFERDVIFHHADGSTSRGRIDLYKRGCFVLEAKQGSDQKAADGLPLFSGAGAAAGKAKKGTAVRGTPGWDDAMVRARAQAESYAKALPASEGWPPFLVVVDVGYSIELFGDFSRTGKHYTHFPDAHAFRLKLDDLARDDIRERLRLVWSDPFALDPSRRSAKVTREIADHLAKLAKSLEAAGHAPHRVAAFLMRCLFTMFAEDVDLLPKGCFTKLLEDVRDAPAQFAPLVKALWEDMNEGADFSAAIRAKVLRFNGGLFKEADAIPLDPAQTALLLEAAKSDWKDVEPAIFGTLLERALDPHERHKLGAHYTPRAYVERLVLPTVIEPLRDDWDAVKEAVVQLARQGDARGAVQEVEAFHRKLCATKVLDPACGTGNFLYVTLEHMKRLEGEALALLSELGETQYLLDLDRHTVTPAQFLGLEINPRAAAIADLVIWIGFLQWHIRTKGSAQPAEPVLKDFRNIDCRDAVLDHDGTELVRDAKGKPVTRWDGRTTKLHPVTGEEVPDEAARVEQLRYKNPRPAKWPAADYVVGNPPFIGNKRMRLALGDGYVEALRRAHDDVPETVDLVMYWWNAAARLTRAGKLKRFGLITTNSITQTFNRKVVQAHLGARRPVSMLFAIPDHPWVDAADGAAVRVAMSMAAGGKQEGLVKSVVSENEVRDEAVYVVFSSRRGTIHADLTVGANVASAVALEQNKYLSFQGVIPLGDGFRLKLGDLGEFGLRPDRLPSVVRPFIIGRDITQQHSEKWIIDFFGLSESQARELYPALFNRVLVHVKPQRDQNNRPARRNKWWVFAENAPKLRRAVGSIPRYIVTMEVSKFKTFSFVDAATIPDHKVYAIATSDAWLLAVLSSHSHSCWVEAAGGSHGIGNDPTWTNTTCFLPFPFPDPPEEIKEKVRALGEELDAFRKARQAEHPALTLTGMYNVLEKLRSGAALTAKEKVIHDQGLVSVLKDIHDRLDAAVFEAYGWPATLSDEEILERLVALNRERAEEEKQGRVRWLRPDFQAPGAAPREVQGELAGLETGEAEAGLPAAKLPWHKDLPAQFQAVRAALASLGRPADARTLARAFKGARADRVAAVLDTMAQMGRVRRTDDGRFAA